MANKLDLTGRVFDSLTVIEEDGRCNQGSVLWKCKCECGRYHTTRSYSLLNGKCVQCTHCTKRRGIRKHGISDLRIGDISAKWWMNRISNKQREGEDNITMKEGWELFLNQDKKCAYTGRVLHFPKGDEIHNATASMDRINSDFGYIRGNVQWVHKDVNVMKNNYSDEFFRKVCQLVYETYQQNEGKSS